MKFKVGDKVRVREDLEAGKDYGDHDVVEDMEKYKGKEFIINEVRRNYYRLKNESWYCWTDKMLEPVEEGEKSMNIEELNLEYKNKMDALMEEYKTKAKELVEEEPFIKEGQGYFAIDRYFGIDEFNYDGNIVDRELLNNGNMFPYTEETRDKVKKEVKLTAERRKLQSEMEMFARLNNDCEIDWSNTEQYKWSLYIDYAKNEIMIYWAPNCRDLNNIYFTSEEIAQQALEKFGDRIRELYLKQEEQ